jgi:septal ring factor EnvC (AmiA/AmiB activator)
MNNVQLYIVVGLPTITVLVGIFLNQRSIDRLERSLGNRIDRLEARLDRIEADLREFYRTLGQHDARLDNLEKRLTQRA